MNLKNIFEEITKERITLSDYSTKKLLKEEDDFGGDGGGDAGGDDAGGGDDPFGGDDGGGDPFGGDDGGGDPFGGDSGSDGGSDDGDADGEEENKEDDEEQNELDLENHKDDPDFTQGKTNPDDLTLPSDPAAKSVLDIEKVLQNLGGLVDSLSTQQLAEYDLFKKCVELICNGKILNEEDLEFKNIQNAIFLLDKVCENLELKTRAYLIRKFKEPLIVKRDKIKQDIAKQQSELDSTRDLVIKLDTFDQK